MALPLKTTSDDVKRIVNYFKTKPTGATLAEASAALSKQIVDPRKVTAYRAWGVISKDGEKYKLTPSAWDFSRRPDTERDFFRQIISGNTAYRSAVEWIFHQGMDSVTTIDVAAHWHQHHGAVLGADVKDATIRENALAFFHLCTAAGLGRLTLGRGGNPTRLAVDREAVATYIEAGPGAPPWAGTDDAIDVDPDETKALEQEPSTLSNDHNGDIGRVAEPAPLTPAPALEPMRVFIAHGKNMEIVEQLETMLGVAEIESEVAEAEETTAIPVPDKVFNAMKRCRAAIISVSVDESRQDKNGGFTINENVLIEIGAAFVLYDRRVVLVWDKRLPVPSNLQGLYRCEYEGDELSWTAGMKLMKAIQDFKK